MILNGMIIFVTISVHIYVNLCTFKPVQWLYQSATVHKLWLWFKFFLNTVSLSANVMIKYICYVISKTDTFWDRKSFVESTNV